VAAQQPVIFVSQPDGDISLAVPLPPEPGREGPVAAALKLHTGTHGEALPLLMHVACSGLWPARSGLHGTPDPLRRSALFSCQYWLIMPVLHAAATAGAQGLHALQPRRRGSAASTIRAGASASVSTRSSALRCLVCESACCMLSCTWVKCLEVVMHMRRRKPTHESVLLSRALEQQAANAHVAAGRTHACQVVELPLCQSGSSSAIPVQRS
jgi:hypothetical protein